MLQVKEPSYANDVYDTGVPTLSFLAGNVRAMNSPGVVPTK
jgi:hypothetical protein